MTELTLPDDYLDRIASRQSALQKSYDETYQLTSADQRSKAEALLARIGSIDWKSEGYQSPEHQRDLSIKFHWGHNHRFAEDLTVVGRMQNRHVSLAAEFLEGFDLPETFFQDKDILDIGCWTGGTMLVLKMLGAKQVLSMEEVRKYGETTNILAKEIYNLSDVNCIPESLYDLHEGQFDCVYFPGVIYHLSDPVLALRRLFNRLRDGGEILVETAGIVNDKPLCWFKGNQQHFGSDKDGDMNRGGWAWFWPSPSCLELWIREAGFDDVRVFQSPRGDRIFAYGKRTGYRDITRAGLSVVDIE